MAARVDFAKRQDEWTDYLLNSRNKKVAKTSPKLGLCLELPLHKFISQ